MIITFKLYHRENGYKCRINTEEINFFYGIDSENIEDINMQLTILNEPYYLEELEVKKA